MYICVYVYICIQGGTGRAGYHETRVPGVPLAGCVLRPGRAINCEVLPGKGERDPG